MKVAPDRAEQHVTFETEDWKPIHQALVDSSKKLGWNLYRVRYPGGTGSDYNFVTVSSYGHLDDVEDPYPEETVSTIVSEKEVPAFTEKTYKARDLVRSELWTMVANAEPAKSSGGPTPYLVVSYMQTPEGKAGEYPSFEEEVARPVHRQLIEEGLMDFWACYQMIAPGGRDYGYNFATANGYSNLSDLEIEVSPELVRRALPEANIQEETENMRALRDNVRSELWVYRSDTVRVNRVICDSSR